MKIDLWQKLAALEKCSYLPRVVCSFPGSVCIWQRLKKREQICVGTGSRPQSSGHALCHLFLFLLPLPCRMYRLSYVREYTEFKTVLNELLSVTQHSGNAAKSCKCIDGFYSFAKDGILHSSRGREKASSFTHNTLKREGRCWMPRFLIWPSYLVLPSAWIPPHSLYSQLRAVTRSVTSSSTARLLLPHQQLDSRNKWDFCCFPSNEVRIQIKS